MTFLYWLLVGAFALDAAMKLDWLSHGDIPPRTTKTLAADIAFNLFVLGTMLVVWR